MNDYSRKQSDYKIGNTYYYVKVYEMIPQYIDFYEIKLLGWGKIIHKYRSKL